MMRFLLLLLMFATGVALAAESNSGNTHQGVTTCASSVCHGKLAAQTRSRIGQHEFNVWSREDPHAQAFKTLQSPESAQMARALGVGAATSASLCLDCHTDNVPAMRRGPKFSLEDGVGCETCHGGAEHWLSSHTKPGVARADNLQKGMFPTDDPVRRAQLCLSCHLGTGARFVSHRLLAAGHPRLTFELESFTEGQPAHYELDDDYVERKQPLAGFTLWLTGQIGAAEAFLDVIARRGNGAPEFALYDCFGCHHRMGDQRWSAGNAGGSLKPGSPRLQAHHFILLEVALAAAKPADSAALMQRIQRLQVAGQESPAAMSQAAQTFRAWLGSQSAVWQSSAWPDDRVRQIRRTILERGSQGKFADYAAAEQAYMAIESLSYHLDDIDARQASIDRLFKTVEEQKKFSSTTFQSVCKQVLGAF